MTATSKSMQDLMQDSYLGSGNESYLEALYEAYLADSNNVSPEWQTYFQALAKQTPASAPDIAHSAIREQFLAMAKHPKVTVVSGGAISRDHERKQEQVINLITNYRTLGHLQADIDPLNLYKGVYNPALDLDYYRFSKDDLQVVFDVGFYAALQKPTATLQELHQSLRNTYCGKIGFEYMHMRSEEEVEWIKNRIENGWVNFQPNKEEKLRLLDRLIVADALEKYLGTKYAGQKRFSLEGGDSLIPMMDTLVNRGAGEGVKEMIIGMAHRGRLNVLVNILGKDPKEIFAAFENKNAAENYSGDVKYHLGYSSNVKTKSGPVHLALAFNPSHLEIISPVVQGSVRARQRRRRDTEQKQVVSIMLHGDAAFAGQGVVMEVFNMSQARWFTIGGTIHIVINNQVGFTISDPKDARSTLYCTDVAKVIEAPILHVNGNDPEAVYYAAQFAMDYHTTFKKDVVIDLFCYRRHGHNEADEPSATQPLMYKVIKTMPTPAALYATQLRAAGLVDEVLLKQTSDAYRDALDAGHNVVETTEEKSVYEYAVKWNPYIATEWNQPIATGVPLAKLQALATTLYTIPAGFVLQAQVKKGIDAQPAMAEGTQPVSWGFAETLAYATLLDEGYPIRLCGQDAGRGTFAHRHAVWHDQNTDQIYIPLSHLSSKQAQINIVDSLLSEEGVLAFEYGYATAEPDNLVLWEAQFGDFANGAQVVIDQFISSGEQKWGRLCGLVMLLPHGYEGMGPEHSSARLERYLQLCAQDNMQVCVPTTAAQIFHLLRRQMKRPYRKPLIVMTPKSILRHPLAMSPIETLTQGSYQLVLPETDKLDNKKIDRVILCCGKVYYDLLTQRRTQSLEYAAILRVEQLYPFPAEVLEKALAPYQQVKDIVWCQEEPQNQGAWPTMQAALMGLLGKGQKLRYAGRPASASPAAGYHSRHEREQHALVDEALL